VPPPVLRPVEVATPLVEEPLPLTSPTPEPHLPTSGSGHHHVRLLHLEAGPGCLLCTAKPALLARADLIYLEVHDLGPVLPPPPEPNSVPPSPRLLTPWMPLPMRADLICLEVHELPSSPQQDQVFLGLKDSMSTSSCPLVVTMGGWLAWDQSGVWTFFHGAST
jgi:hypothetical protein